MHYIFLSSTSVASAWIQFSPRHAVGEKNSWQEKDKQSKRNKVMALEGKKGNIKRQEKGRQKHFKTSEQKQTRQRNLDDKNRKINTQEAVSRSCTVCLCSCSLK